MPDRHFKEILSPCDMGNRVKVHFNSCTNLFQVMQEGKTVGTTNRLYLCAVRYVGGSRPYVEGLLCTAQDVREATEAVTGDLDATMDYTEVSYKDDAYSSREGLPVDRSDFCDMSTDDDEPMLAIWMQEVPIEREMV